MTSWREYDSKPRRRGRALLRLAQASVTPSLYPRAQVVPAYWWDGHPNFGDALTPWLLRRYGRVAVHTSPLRARMAGVGSILEQLPTGFRGTVWGSGLLWGKPVQLPHARFAAVRGERTREILGLPSDVALGDPGLLVSRHLGRRPARWELGFVPHGMHANHPAVGALQERYPHDVAVIEPWHPVDSVLGRIARCARVVSTSLHGLVIADALGIPAAWTELEPVLWGADFKFRDYESVVTPGRSRRVELSPETTLTDLSAAVRPADSDQVGAAVVALEAALEEIPGDLLPPFLAWRAR